MTTADKKVYEETFNNWVTRLFTNKGDNDE